jgi:hypothetical protein
MRGLPPMRGLPLLRRHCALLPLLALTAAGQIGAGAIEPYSKPAKRIMVEPHGEREETVAVLRMVKQ